MPWLALAATMVTACDRAPMAIVPDDALVHDRPHEPAPPSACVVDPVADAEQRLEEKPLVDRASTIAPLLVVSATRR